MPDREEQQLEQIEGTIEDIIFENTRGHHRGHYL